MGKGAKAPTTNPFPSQLCKTSVAIRSHGGFVHFAQSGRAGCGQRNRNFHYTTPPQICQAFFAK
jgi:hypothetical protein